MGVTDSPGVSDGCSPGPQLEHHGGGARFYNHVQANGDHKNMLCPHWMARHWVTPGGENG